MAATVTIYHNPRCSKSRQTLKLLEEKGHTPEVVAYLDTPPSASELEIIARKLGLAPRQFLRTKEKPYAELGLDRPETGDAEILKAMAAHPILIERPIVVRGDAARIGRPPENVLEIL